MFRIVNVYIHHSRTTTDSRNGTLFLLYLKTGKCECNLFYDGHVDRLLRFNKVREKHRLGTVIHFISYDLLNTYYEQQMKSGQPKDSFIKSRNSLNKDFRGSSTEIPIRIFHKGVEIYMHSLVYNKELAFNCEKCPKILGRNKREEDFQNVFECHVIDGINMGNIEKPRKTLTDDIFEENKVENIIMKGVEAADRTAI